MEKARGYYRRDEINSFKIVRISKYEKSVRIFGKIKSGGFIKKKLQGGFWGNGAQLIKPFVALQFVTTFNLTRWLANISKPYE